MDLKQRLQRFLGQQPEFGEAAFVASNAILLGDIKLGRDSSVWYGVVARADINAIRVGAGTNLQDGVIVHLADDMGVTVEDFTTVGHRAILHACAIGHECLIGMGATILDHSEIGDHCIIGANTLVPRRMKIPPESLVYGNPARLIRPLTGDERKSIRKWAVKYITVAAAHRVRQEK